MNQTTSGPAESGGSSVSEQRPHGIVIVDDDADTRALVAEALQIDGYVVRTAETGAEALRLIAEQTPEVAIVDLLMPGMDGAEVCAAIRGNPTLDHTRILVLSGAEDARLVAAFCNADSAVVKPFTLGLLKHEVRRLMGS
jgi:DNA-binding response OmpR family regulator